MIIENDAFHFQCLTDIIRIGIWTDPKRSNPHRQLKLRAQYFYIYRWKQGKSRAITERRVERSWRESGSNEQICRAEATVDVIHLSWLCRERVRMCIAVVEESRSEKRGGGRRRSTENISQWNFGPAGGEIGSSAFFRFAFARHGRGNSSDRTLRRRVVGWGIFSVVRAQRRVEISYYILSWSIPAAACYGKKGKMFAERNRGEKYERKLEKMLFTVSCVHHSNGTSS